MENTSSLNFAITYVCEGRTIGGRGPRRPRRRAVDRGSCRAGRIAFASPGRSCRPLKIRFAGEGFRTSFVTKAGIATGFLGTSAPIAVDRPEATAVDLPSRPKAYREATADDLPEGLGIGYFASLRTADDLPSGFGLSPISRVVDAPKFLRSLQSEAMVRLVDGSGCLPRWLIGHLRRLRDLLLEHGDTAHATPTVEPAGRMQAEAVQVAGEGRHRG